jgi:hypothetical protein
MGVCPRYPSPSMQKTLSCAAVRTSHNAVEITRSGMERWDLLRVGAAVLSGVARSFYLVLGARGSIIEIRRNVAGPWLSNGRRVLLVSVPSEATVAGSRSTCRRKHAWQWELRNGCADLR